MEGNGGGKGGGAQKSAKAQGTKAATRRTAGRGREGKHTGGKGRKKKTKHGKMGGGWREEERGKKHKGGGAEQGGRNRRTQKQKRRGWERPRSAEGQGTRGREAQKAGDNGGARGEGERNEKHKGKKNKQSAGNPSPEGAEQRRRTGRPQEKVWRTRTRPGGRPARPGQKEHAHTHARDPGVASSDPKGEVSASTQNSPGAPAESPVERRTVRETRRVSDRVHTRQTTAAHAAQDRSRRDPPGTTLSRGPERVRRGARPAPLPGQGPAAGTKSPVLGRPPRAPRSHPVKPVATAPGVGEGTTATGKPTGAPVANGPDEARRTNAGPRGTPERHAAGHNHGMHL